MLPDMGIWHPCLGRKKAASFGRADKAGCFFPFVFALGCLFDVFFLRVSMFLLFCFCPVLKKQKLDIFKTKQIWLDNEVLNLCQ